MKGVLVRAIVLAAGLLLAGALIIDWNALVWAGVYRETNDAALRGDPTRLAARVAGYVAEVAVTDDQPVRAGDLLYLIEDDDYRARVDRAQADVAQAEAGVALADARIAAQRAQVDAAVAETVSSGAELERARLELVRQDRLLGTESGLRRAWEAAAAQEKRLGAMRAGDESAVAAARAQVEVLQARAGEARALLKAQRAALAFARTQLGYTRIVAPADGVVGARLVRRGQYVAADTALITLVPLRDVWAVANYREEQLTKMRVGQPAKITVDAFPGVVFHGWVDSLEPASEARGALMPPDRAVGNFTKIVQRVPVKIRLDRTAPEKGGDARFAWANGRLVPGLSVESVVDTRFMPASVAASGAPSGAAAGVDGAP